MRAHNLLPLVFLGLLPGCGQPVSVSPVERQSVDPNFSGLVFVLTDAGGKSQSLGRFRPSERRQVAVRLENRTGRVLKWDSIQVSCECLTVRLLGSQLDVNGRMDGVVVLDLGHTPDFRGGLMLTAEAMPAGGGRSAFTLDLLADVE